MIAPKSTKASLPNIAERGRPPYGFVLLDCPSDHEIDGNLVTECQVVQSLLSNRRLGSATKLIRVTSYSGFRNSNWKTYNAIGFLHVAGHGSKFGLGFIGGNVSWKDVAKTLKKVAPKLDKDKQRVLCLSCCHSLAAYRAMKTDLKGHFTGAYHFSEEKISFATAMTVWAMFYRRKTLERPHAAVVKAINDFFGKEVIGAKGI
ncbi:hypothetical protein [Acidibrevibacterium fodinaquatile]|uniref:hypothetical protein n=1 Tax=Acidibrevibacterium fodinaquatile TaxID=1969806 RepID=UPI0013B42E7D|nr:hypothetical protein [Acidibrevibacterium fodinaquatile]